MATITYALHLIQDEANRARWAVTLDGVLRGYVTEHIEMVAQPEPQERGEAAPWSYEDASGGSWTGPEWEDRASAAWALLASTAH